MIGVLNFCTGMVVINLLSYTNKKDKNVSSKFADEYIK